MEGGGDPGEVLEEAELSLDEGVLFDDAGPFVVFGEVGGWFEGVEGGEAAEPVVVAEHFDEGLGFGGLGVEG